MLSSRIFRPLPNLASAFVAVALITGGTLSGAQPGPTQMAPFQVEAEFGVDGLRIQNSQSVLNQHLLEEHGVAQMQDIAGISPNLFISNSDSRGFGDVLALRGSANSIFFSGPSVALYLDDVPSGSVSSYPSTLLNIETLIVKAGPQGTDYGRNAPAGVIDIKSRVPGNSHQGSLLLDYGSYDSRSAQLAVDGPVGAKAGYSASFGYNEREGYMDNTFLGRTADDRQAFTGRGAFYVRPDETLQLRFGFLVENVDDDATRLSSLFSPDRFAVSSDLNGLTRLDRQQFSFQLRKTFSWGSVISTTARQDWELDPALTDLDLSAFPAAFSRVQQEEKLWTQELRFESNLTANKAQWRAGLFYFDSGTEGNALRQFVVPPSAFVPPGFVQTERTLFQLDQKNFAGYANFDHPLSELTILKLGLRLEHTESEIDRTKAATNNFGFPSPQDAPVIQDQSSDTLSASLGFVHAITNSLSLSARTSLAHKPEGYSAFAGSPALARFDDERQWANEVGITFGPRQGRFGGSVLGFWNRIRGYQFERTVPNSTDFVVVNAEEVISRGFEAKFMWNPVDRVWWDFQAGYADTTFEKHRYASGSSVSGQQVPFIPHYTWRTGITVDLGQGFSVNASYSAVGRAFYDERNSAAFSQKSYHLVNAQLRYRFDRWAITLYGRNLFEKEYYQFINPEIFAGSPGAPRRYGVQLSFTY